MCELIRHDTPCVCLCVCVCVRARARRAFVNVFAGSKVQGRMNTKTNHLLLLDLLLN